MIRIDSQTNEEYNKRTEILTLLSTIREDKERLIALKSSYELRNSTLKTNIREMKQFLSQSKKRHRSKSQIKLIEMTVYSEKITTLLAMNTD